MRSRAVGFFLIGGAIIAAALFADVIGLDNDPGWGKGRIAILVFGMLVIAWGIFYSLYSEQALSISRQIQFLVSQNIMVLGNFPLLVYASNPYPCYSCLSGLPAPLVDPLGSGALLWS
jgi:hypothetical protein